MCVFVCNGMDIHELLSYVYAHFFLSRGVSFRSAYSRLGDIRCLVPSRYI